MSKTKNEVMATTNNAMTATFAGVTFNTDAILAPYMSEENGVISYNMEVEVLDDKLGVSSMSITDSHAIEAIIGIRNSEKLEKWSAYRKGAYLVQLVDSSFMKDNDISSVERLAKTINLGIEGSSANSMENVARKLGVAFDVNGNLSFADDTLPLLPFWHYNNIISLVTDKGDGTYNYDSLKDFLKVANVSPLMSQKRVKELFNDYRNGRLGNLVAIPDKVSEKAKADAKRAAENKAKAEKAKATVSAKTAIDNAETFTEKQAVALSALEAFKQCIENMGTVLEIDFDTIRTLIVNAEEVKPTATPKN